MTSTTGTTQHPDVPEISAFGEDLLSPDRAAEIRLHLLTCASCAEVHSSLEEIRSLLGTTPAPGPMPADIAGRIEAALDAEALLGASAPAGMSRESRDVSRETSRLASVRPLREQTPGADSGTLRERSASRPSAGPPLASAGPGRRSARYPRRKAVLGAVFGVAVLGVGILFSQTAGTSDEKAASSAAMDAPTPDPEEGGKSSVSPEFTEANLPDQVHLLLGASPAPPQGGKDEGLAPSGAQPSAPEAMRKPDVPGCVLRALGHAATALGAEAGAYQGTGAYLVVVPHPTDDRLVTAAVVDAECAVSDPSGTGSLLLTHTYPRA
ncbi:zf-HC2 domain-containing protein [Streptomyces sp. NBC_00101]|uniref:anti-sigma factor family protein n=1 Tax=Streptomyces sp. NBC_00101 TaxID=2975651 RepID=UPI0032525514